MAVLPSNEHSCVLKADFQVRFTLLQTKYGDIFDCVDIYKQHAFDNPLLKNLTIPFCHLASKQLVIGVLCCKQNTHIPYQNWNKSLSSLQGQKLAKIRAILDGGCPEGSVPIRRIRMQDVLRAPSLYLEGKKYAGNVTYQGDSIHPQEDNRADHHYGIVQLKNGQYFGTKVAMSLWNPQPVNRELFSLSQFWVAAGPDANVNTIESGWMVSQVDGAQFGQTLQTAQEPRSGDWLFLFDEDDVILGYLPRRLLPILGNGPATRVDWGGETYNPFHDLPLPPMGSGRFPREGPRKSSYITQIRVVDTNRHLVDAPLNTETYTDKPGCYGVDDPRVNYGGEVGRAISYGGPGGMCIEMISKSVEKQFSMASRVQSPVEPIAGRLDQNLHIDADKGLCPLQTKYGDIFDCVDIYKQPAFDHPLLKNHTLRRRPTSLPKPTKDPSPSNDGGILAKIRALMDGGCPEGTVPIRRTRMQDLLRAPSLYLHGEKYAGNRSYVNLQDGHHYAVIRATQGTFYGTKVAINLWGVTLSDNHMFSLVQFWVIGGPIEHINTIEVGWTANPALYGDQLTRLFTFWTSDGYRTGSGCYNAICPGYVQLNPQLPLGITYPQMSVYNGPQTSVTLQTFQDPRNGDWWLLWGEDNGILGYFPSGILPVLGRGPATRMEWGGETYTPPNLPFPPMGSGHFAAEGFGKASYLRWIRVYDGNRNAVDAPLDTEVFVDRPPCYTVEDPRMLYGGEVGRVFFYGGPGGVC
ncbi:aslB [Cinnamomum micranthum f. kanehirae]|uniref:AslB n=1 Tax=Cinnamomum micranthum f. kanehirae TaxID=337451 RepID=A0A3S3MD67_9MAGN|nr:aslB [Cinnamomum micranthum f. kanehirae]